MDGGQLRVWACEKDHSNQEKWCLRFQTHQKNGRHQKPELKGHVKSPVPLNEHPRWSLQLSAHFWSLKTFPLIPIFCSPYPAFSSLPVCYSQIPNHSSHIFLYSPSPSFTSLYPTSSLPYSKLNPHPQSCRLPSRPSVSLELPLQSGPASSVLFAPTPLPSLSLSSGVLAPRPPTAPDQASFISDPSIRSALDWATPPLPPKGRSREWTRRHPPPLTPRPITGPAAASSSSDGLCRPRCCRRRPSPVGGREARASPGTAATVAEFLGRQDGERGWVGRSAGRRRRADGSGKLGGRW